MRSVGFSQQVLTILGQPSLHDGFKVLKAELAADKTLSHPFPPGNAKHADSIGAKLLDKDGALNGVGTI